MSAAIAAFGRTKVLHLVTKVLHLPAVAALLCISSPCRSEQIQSDAVMKNTRYETPYFIKTGAAPGPTVVVIGGLHGDESAGYLAARKLVEWKITRGKLVDMPDAHREAIRRNVRGYPGNMNNMFPGKANGSPMQRLAYEIWQTIKNSRPDLLLTLHESRDFHANDPKRYGQTFCFDFDALVPYMTRALHRVNANIVKRKHKFLIFVAPFPHCPTYQSWMKLKIPATSIETSRTLPIDVRVRYQLMAVQAFFDEAGLGYEQGDAPRLAVANRKPGAPVDSQTFSNHRAEKSASEEQTIKSPPVKLDFGAAQAGSPERSQTSRTALLVSVMACAGALLGFFIWRVTRARDGT